MKIRYNNIDPAHQPQSFRAVVRWAIVDPLLRRRRPRPPGPPAPYSSPDLDLLGSAVDALRLTWIGHASFLLQIAGRNLLLDPVFGARVGVVYRRYGRPGLTVDSLPPIDVVLVSHNHYDHLEPATLETIPGDPVVIVPAGVTRHLGRRSRSRAVELEWWQKRTVAGVLIHFVPSRHWSRRGVLDTNRSLWGGFVIQAQGRSVYFAGDTAWFEHFRDIGSRFPGLDAAILPIGGYDPAWFMENNHLNPEQAGQAFILLGARRLVPMHWGALRLTDEPLCEPIRRLEDWWARRAPRDGQELVTLAVGQTMVIDG